MNINKEIITQLKKLRFIEPDPAFVRGSRSLILSTNRVPARPHIWLWASAATVTFTLFIIVAAASYHTFFSPKPTLSSSFNSKSLEQEFNNLTINIRLEEIEYQQKMNQVIVSALNEIQNTHPSHLNNSLLKSEEADIYLDESINPRIDKLLEKVIF